MSLETNQKAKTLAMAAANGNLDALHFLGTWNAYCHAVDDLVDKPETSAESKVQTFVLANIVYSTKFYQSHAAELQIPVILLSNAYADSVDWCNAPEHTKRQAADILRFSGNEMILAVAFICGGWQLVRKLSPQLRVVSFQAHENGA